MNAPTPTGNRAYFQTKKSNPELSSSNKSKSLEGRTINLSGGKFTPNSPARERDFHVPPNPLLHRKYIVGERIWNNPPTFHNAIQIGELLGKGGYGEVYKISPVSSPDQFFALKVPGEPLELTKGYILNEIHKLQTLNKTGNAHIPKIKYGFFSLQGEKIPYYITHQFTSVEHRFATFDLSVPVDPLRTLEIFYSIALGLKYITSHNIVHNDVKPENIMFYHDLPIITDYGTARSYSEINEIEIERLQGRLHGTPTWLPPELISIVENPIGKPLIFFNLSKVSQKTDVWGLGLVLFRYLTGKSLFHDVPLKNDQIPDIFYTIHHQFHQAKIVSRYRQHCHKILYRLYSSGDPLSKKQSALNVDKIRQLLADLEPLEDTHSRTLEEGKSGRIFLNRLLLKKIHLLERPRSDFEIEEFFLAFLFDIFDMCVAPSNERIKIYYLVDLLESIFPGLQGSLAQKTRMEIFPELACPYPNV